MKLKNRSALITGAGRGIGRAIAIDFAREGASPLYLTSRTTSELDAVKAACAAHGAKVTCISADLSKRETADQIAAAVGQRLDILVNNAGIGSSANPKPVAAFDDDFWDQTLWLNLTVPYLLTRRFLPGMIAARRGRIIHIASIAGKLGSTHGAAYSASKHGLIGLTKSTALEVAKDGVTVNAICPGVVASRMNDRRIAYDAQRLGKTTSEVEAGSTPLGRRLTPEEISPLAVFLASDDAVAINGQSYNVDAGTIMV